MTPADETDERRKQATQALLRSKERLAARLCRVCGAPVESYDQVGKCVYADPCGHRQYQGKAP